MTGYVVVNASGSYRPTWNPFGKFEPSKWGTVDEQIAEATAANLRAHSSIDHTSQDLWTMASDCGHTDPCDDDTRFRGVEELIDSTWERDNVNGLSWKDGDAFYDARRASRRTIWSAVFMDELDSAYHDIHDGGVCLKKYQGTCCMGCTEGDEDFGFEVGACQRQERARESFDEFWDAFSVDAIEYLRSRR
jgi:hypothetical protein